MIERLKVLVSSKSWFWKARAWLGKIVFFFDRSSYKMNVSVTGSIENARVSGSIAWIGVKSLFWVVSILALLNYVEVQFRDSQLWLPPLSDKNKIFIIEQLRLYAQMLTAIFSIYFATTGIILSAGYTRLRRDIIQMLTNEQVGSLYSRILVLSTIFCLIATTFPLFGYEPGLFIYIVGTGLTLLSALALFPLGQRLFNFFDLNVLARSEILPNIVRHIQGAASPRTSISLANHHSRAAQKALEQLSYIDVRVKVGKESLEDTLPALSECYAALLLYYLQQKHTINPNSYWFPRRIKHKQWFLAGDSTTSMALRSSNQQVLIEEKTDHQWLENEIVDRLAGHLEFAFRAGDFDLALKLLARFSNRISGYAHRFHFDIGMQEIIKFKEIIESTLSSSDVTMDDESVKKRVVIADTWAALGSSLCLETLRRMVTFEKELKQFFEADVWSERSLRRLPAFMQVELGFIIERIEFEREIEGHRLSKPKYVQQLAIQKLLKHYAEVLPAICNFYQNLIPGFVGSMTKLKLFEAATQVVLASLHSHSKLPRWFDDLTQLMGLYYDYGHYTEEQYKLPEINTAEMAEQLASSRDEALAWLGNEAMVGNIFTSKDNDEMPDHFGQIYFELGEACIIALEQNNESKLEKVLPMFMSLTLLVADTKFRDSSMKVSDEYRLHLFSTVIIDLASVLGYAILYDAYFNNESLSKDALAKFETWISRAADKQQYLKRMLLLSDPFSFSASASPRDLIRINWKTSFEHRARNDGFGDQMSMTRGKPHPNKIVRDFLQSNCDASHLFFAKHVLPQLEPIDFKVSHWITSLAQQLREDDEVQHEGF
ncbi:hypothetical protein [Pseudomonas sp.]|uniref:hypothetical protein n=1 Tax=Pseudomonas sp. TaxID=306 RepID=UPI003C646F16